jgi:predicted SprT family Zn-dependent metalloprotease
MNDIRDSVESVDTENTLLPLLERLGIDVPVELRAGRVAPRSPASSSGDEKEEEEKEEEIVYTIDRDGCVILSDDDCAGTGVDRESGGERGGSFGENDRNDRNDKSAGNTGQYDEGRDWSIASSNTATPTRVLFPRSALEPSFLYADRLLHAVPQKQRQSIAEDMYRTYNARIFDDQLPTRMEISWNKKLTSTAGLTHYKRSLIGGANVYTCRIELASKVLDTATKLERTLIHEMCHCAAWMIDHVAKPPHGETFKKYAVRAMTIVPRVNVSTCHTYDIFHPFKWQCSVCYHEYGRHSNSIDVDKKVCGKDSCGGKLVFLGKFKMDGDGSVSPVKRRSISGYSAYVKKHFHRVKEDIENAGGQSVLASDVMKRLAAEWQSRESRESRESVDGIREPCPVP